MLQANRKARICPLVSTILHVLCLLLFGLQFAAQSSAAQNINKFNECTKDYECRQKYNNSMYHCSPLTNRCLYMEASDSSILTKSRATTTRKPARIRSTTAIYSISTTTETTNVPQEKNNYIWIISAILGLILWSAVVTFNERNNNANKTPYLSVGGQQLSEIARNDQETRRAPTDGRNEYPSAPPVEIGPALIVPDVQDELNSYVTPSAPQLNIGSPTESQDPPPSYERALADSQTVQVAETPSLPPYEAVVPFFVQPKKDSCDDYNF